mgnify:CR=1 FL=1
MSNQLKTLLLMGLLSGIFLAIGLLIGGRFGLTIALITAIIMNFLAYWFSAKIALFMYRAKEADKKEYSLLYELVRETADKANLPMPKVYIIKSNAANAFATGRNYKNSYVAFTEGILSLLNEDELKGVIAHELSHIKNRDILVATIAAVIASAISYLALIGRFGIIFGSGSRNGDQGNVLELLLLLILTPIITMFIQFGISRSREYLADESGARILNNSRGLSSALYKLENSDKHGFHGSKAGASLFIVNPFSGQAFINLLSTHPPVTKRIEKLNSIKF